MNQNLHKQQNLSWLKLIGGVDSSKSFAQLHSTETETQIQQDVDESRSYDPYLIAYHEESNSFTYNDPWIQVVQESPREIQSSCNDNENSFTVEKVVTTVEISTAHASLEPTITPQQNGWVQATDNGHESTTENVSHYVVVPPVPTVTIETVPEVSFPHNEFTTSSLRCCRSFSVSNLPLFPQFVVERKCGCG